MVDDWDAIGKIPVIGSETKIRRYKKLYLLHLQAVTWDLLKDKHRAVNITNQIINPRKWKSNFNIISFPRGNQVFY